MRECFPIYNFFIVSSLFFEYVFLRDICSRLTKNIKVVQLMITYLNYYNQMRPKGCKFMNRNFDRHINIPLVNILLL